MPSVTRNCPTNLIWNSLLKTFYKSIYLSFQFHEYFWQGLLRFHVLSSELCSGANLNYRDCRLLLEVEEPPMSELRCFFLFS